MESCGAQPDVSPRRIRSVAGARSEKAPEAPSGGDAVALMIDIHCHPLPGLDDGAKTLEDAVEMCRMAAADGITHLVATPHCNYEYPFRPEENQAKLARLQAEVGDVPNLLL